VSLVMLSQPPPSFLDAIRESTSTLNPSMHAKVSEFLIPCIHHAGMQTYILNRSNL
jgi:hypothetical protein